MSSKSDKTQVIGAWFLKKSNNAYKGRGELHKPGFLLRVCHVSIRHRC